MPRAVLPLVLACLAAALVGCGGDRPELASVSGVVTDGGTPVAGATVEFQPAQGRASYATTAADGRYELNYSADLVGAVLGPHSVRVTVPAGSPAKAAPPGGAREEVAETPTKTLALPTPVQVGPGENAVEIDLAKAAPIGR